MAIAVEQAAITATRGLGIGATLHRSIHCTLPNDAIFACIVHARGNYEQLPVHIRKTERTGDLVGCRAGPVVMLIQRL